MDTEQMINLAESARKQGNYTKALEYYKNLLKQGHITWKTAYYALYCDTILKPGYEPYSELSDITYDIMDEYFNNLEYMEKGRLFGELVDSYIKFAEYRFNNTVKRAENHDETADIGYEAYHCAGLMDDLVLVLSHFPAGTGGWINRLLKTAVGLYVIYVEEQYKEGLIEDKDEYRDATEELRETIKRIRKREPGYIPPEPNVPDNLKVRLAPPPILSASTSSQEQNKSSQGCYIATNVYGSYDCPQVWVLRRFRDKILAENGAGKVFIKIYYALSPGFVARFGRIRSLNNVIKSILDKFIDHLKVKGFEDTWYNDR